MTGFDHPDFVSQSGNVSTYDILGTYIVPAGSAGPDIDVSNYDSIIAYCPTAYNAGQLISVIDTVTNALITKLTTPAGAAGAGILTPRVIAVFTNTLHLFNASAAQQSVTVIGTNRVGTKPVQPGTWGGIDNITLASNPIPLGINFLGLPQGSGACFVDWEITSAVPKGRLAVKTESVFMNIADTTQMHAMPTGSQGVFFEWIAPIDQCALYFLCDTIGTASVIVNLIYQ